MIECVRHIWPFGIRVQLMLWYTSIFAILLFLFSVIFYLALQNALSSEVDADLHLRAQQLVAGLVNDNGTITSADVLEELPRLDTNATGNISTGGSNRAGHMKGPSDVNFGTLVRILDAKGRTIYVTPAFRTLLIPLVSVTQPLHGTSWQGTLIAPAGQAMRVYSRSIMYDKMLFGVVQVGESLTPLHTTLQSVVVKLLLIAPFILVCGAFGSYWLAAHAFVSIHHLTAIAQKISAGDLHRRVPVPGARDEVQRLALTFNTMIERLDEAFLRQRRFVADASHELRTPAAAIRTMTDVALAQSPTLEECLVVLSNVNTQAVRLGRLISDLLILARSDEGQIHLEGELVRLDLLTSDVVATLEPLAIERGIALQVQKLEPATVVGDPSWLIQSVINLLDNALTYTDTGGTVTLTVEMSGNCGCISVCDTGIGIAPEDIIHIFERFYRADPARSQRRKGSGLGLAIVDGVVHAHGGSIHVESQVGQGSTFLITLPLADCS